MEFKIFKQNDIYDESTSIDQTICYGVFIIKLIFQNCVINILFSNKSIYSTNARNDRII